MVEGEAAFGSFAFTEAAALPGLFALKDDVAGPLDGILPVGPLDCKSLAADEMERLEVMLGKQNKDVICNKCLFPLHRWTNRIFTCKIIRLSGSRKMIRILTIFQLLNVLDSVSR